MQWLFKVMATQLDIQMMDAKLDKVREWYANGRPYRPPRQINADDSADVQDIDEIKMHELKEVKVKFTRKWLKFKKLYLVL